MGDRRVPGIHWPSITAKLMAAGPGEDLVAAGPGEDLVAAGPGRDLSQNTMMGRLQRLNVESPGGCRTRGETCSEHCDGEVAETQHFRAFALLVRI